VKGTQQDVLDVPDAIDVVASGPAYGGLVNVEAARESGLAKVSSQNLQVDFLAFLASHEADGSGAVAVAGNGAITFKSKNDLAKLVAEFSYEKLKQISAAARALARYVDDLEGELEQADVQVVQLRTQMREAGRVAAQRDAALAEVQRKTGEVEGRLGVTQAELDASEFALEEAERRADEAADQLLSLQSTIREAEERGESAQAKQNEAESLAVKFEEQLLDAERRALASERAKRKLTSELEQLARARADADMRALSANEMVLAMEQRSLAAEEAAERKAQELDDMMSQRERNGAQLQEAVSSLEKRLCEIDSAAIGDPRGIDINYTTQLEMQAETTWLRAELRDVLDADHIDFRAAATDGARAGLAGPPPISRMRKFDLAAECSSYGIDASGTVAELRARLRAERKRRQREERDATAASES